MKNDEVRNLLSFYIRCSSFDIPFWFRLVRAVFFRSKKKAKHNIFISCNPRSFQLKYTHENKRKREVADETIQSAQRPGFNPGPVPQRSQPGTKQNRGNGGNGKSRQAKKYLAVKYFINELFSYS